MPLQMILITKIADIRADGGNQDHLQTRFLLVGVADGVCGWVL
jgi:hypothetical protein